MTSERIKLQGRRAELEQLIDELETRGQNHIITIRDLIDPLYDSFPDIQVKRAEQAMISLRVLVLEARQALKKLDKIKKELGDG